MLYYFLEGDRMETDAVIAVNETVSDEFDNLTDEELAKYIKSADALNQ